MWRSVGLWQSVGLLGRDRLLEKLLPRALGKKPPFILVGQRGVGKTCLLEWCYQHARDAGKTAALISCAETMKEVLCEMALRWGVQIYRKGKIVEYRYYIGLTVPEVAKVMEISARTVNSDWKYAKAWIRREMTAGA